MTAKVASPASPAEDLACRGPLKAKRSLYTEDQLSFTHKVLQTPTKQGRCAVCLFDVEAAGFTSDFYFCARLYLLFTVFLLFCGWLSLSYGSLLPLSELMFSHHATGLYTRPVCWALCSLSTRPTLSQTPLGYRVTTLGLVWPHQSKKWELWTACPIIWNTGLPCL